MLDLKNKIEALIFLSKEPLSIDELTKYFKLEKQQIEEAVDELKEDKKDTGINLKTDKEILSFVTNPSCGEEIKNFFHPELKIKKLSKSTMETLAIIAYKGPITKSEIELIRGVSAEKAVGNLLEKNLIFVEAICDVLHQGEIQATGGLLSWLNCLDHPKGWLMIKPLCAKVQQSLGGFPVFQLSTDVLTEFELPAQHIIVVENIQSGLALPMLENSIVVCGGGKNIKWLDAAWLQHKKVYYWGDLDSEGLNILSMVRQKIPDVIPLMMDEATVLQFQDKMVDEPDSVFSEPQYLTAEELSLFHALRKN